MSPLALKNALFLPIVLHLVPIPVPSAPLLLALAPAIPRLHLQSPAVQIHLLSAGITEIMLIRPRNVAHHVPGRETSRPAGGCVFPPCWFYKIFPGSPPGQAVFSTFSCRLWSLHLSNSGPSLINLLRCQQQKVLQSRAQVPGLFLYVLVPVVLTVVPTGSSFSSYPRSGFSLSSQPSIGRGQPEGLQQLFSRFPNHLVDLISSAFIIFSAIFSASFWSIVSWARSTRETTSPIPRMREARRSG